MIEDLCRYNYAPRTQQTYVAQIAKLAKHFGTSPDRLTREQVQEYQDLLVHQGVSWLPQAVAAMQFFYNKTLGRDWKITHSYRRKPSRMFRGKFLALVKEARRRGELTLKGRLQPLESHRAFRSWLGPLYDKEWVVYAKPPWNGPEQALKYLARYTHRVAIGNRRLQSIDDGQVTFSYKDYRREHRQRTLTLSAMEFIRRFMMHVLPGGFVRIRYYGFLANTHRKEQLRKMSVALTARRACCGPSTSRRDRGYRKSSSFP